MLNDNGKIIYPAPELASAGARIHGEIDNGMNALGNIGRAVAIFGGSRVPKDSAAYASAFNLGKTLSDKGYAIITGGGPGIMEAANAGAKHSGKGRSVGLNIKLQHESAPNDFQDTEVHFFHFASRKVIFCRIADAFVVYPGGFGTLDELSEILTLIQTKKMDRVPVILVGKEFWAPFSKMFEVMSAAGLVSGQDKELFSIVDDTEVLGHLDNVLNASTQD